jgi:hypothetical protein
LEDEEGSEVEKNREEEGKEEASGSAVGRDGILLKVVRREVAKAFILCGDGEIKLVGKELAISRDPESGSESAFTPLEIRNE